MPIWTVGHSTRTIEEFIDILCDNQIEILVDVRHFPGLRRFPHFNKPALCDTLTTAGIRYELLVELGGRRPVKPDSHNVAWRNASFRGYADYMETGPFRDGADRLLVIAGDGRTAIMCSEAVWWRCHRSMIADDLKARGWQVFHILGANKIQEHPYTSAARLVEGQLTYEGVLGSVEPKRQSAQNKPAAALTPPMLTLGSDPESGEPDAVRDTVDEASEESFPASDAPAWIWPRNQGDQTNGKHIQSR